MQDLLRNFRRYWLYAGFFSFFCNILTLASPLYMLQVYDRVLSSRSPETLIALTGITLAMMIVMTLLEGVRSRVLQTAGLALEAQAGPLVVGRLMEGTANPASRNSQQQATLRDTQLLSQFISGPGVQAFFDAPWAPIFLLVIFCMHWLMGLFALGGALLLLATAVLNERITRGALEEAAREQRKANRFVETSLQNAEVVVALGMQDNVISRWRKLGQRGTAAQARAGRLGGLFSGSTKFFRQALQTVMLGVGAWAVIEMQASSGIMIAATIILGKALAPVELAVAGWRAFVDARGAYKRLDELMREQQRDDANRTVLPEPKGQLTVENVSFAIRNPDRVILRGVSFALAPGESLGLIGPSAAGKSTLARMIAGVWRPTQGAVRLDGAELSQWNRGQLSKHLGYLPQDVELLAGTVAENIARLGEVNSEQVVAAAQLAQVHELILSLPQGYETDIGERGVNLSAGQRQRVGLARALYGVPRLVVLDEPNSNLDAAGEDGLVGCLRNLKAAGVTCIIVSHKPSLLSGVDRLAVMREGKLELFGPTAEVMKQLSKPPGPPLQAVKDEAMKRG